MYPSDIRSLTGLRIVAAAWVLAFHFRNHLGLDLGRFGLVAKGYLGVDLFFILSGFILSHVYMKAWSDERFSYGGFLWARLARIYPVHLVTLAATVALWLLAGHFGATFDPVAFDPKVLPQHLLLIHAWGTTPSAQWNFPSWSISAEWFAYLAFPVAAWASVALSQRPRVGVILALAVFVAMMTVTTAVGAPLTKMTSQGGVLRIIPAFLMGVALHRLGSRYDLSLLAARLGVLIATTWVVVATSVGLGDIWIWPALAGLIFCLAECAKAGRSGVLAAPLLVYLGEVSYAVYMTHLPVDIGYFEARERWAPGIMPWAAWVGVMVVCLMVSVAVHHLVERPARAWLRARDPFSRTRS